MTTLFPKTILGSEVLAEGEAAIPKRTYREEVKRTANISFDAPNTNLTLGALGLAGEAGEVIEIVKKCVFHGKPIDRENLLKELGDVRWYFEHLLITNGFTMEEVEAANVAKLRARFPLGFSNVAANAKADERDAYGRPLDRGVIQ